MNDYIPNYDLPYYEQPEDSFFDDSEAKAEVSEQKVKQIKGIHYTEKPIFVKTDF